MSEPKSILEGLRNYFHSLKMRIVNALENLLHVRIASEKKPKIKVLSSRSNETGARRTRRRTYTTRIGGSTGGIIRISHRNETIDASAPATTVELTTSVDGRISVTEGIQTCRACGVALASADRKAKCRLDAKHVIHIECVTLIKNKCPFCGGGIY